MSAADRVRVWFTSGGVECAGWHYRGSNGACVVMAGGFAITKEPGTDRFANRFHEAGYSVLAFDYRHLGESGGTPRQIAPIKGQLADWEAALQCAARLPGVDPARLAIWGFSVSGGHVVRVAAGHSNVAAAIAQSPNLDGLAAARNAARYTTRRALTRLMVRGLVDSAGSLVHAEPLLVPLVGEPGTVALLSTPDAVADSDQALNPGNRYPEWQQAVAARSGLAVSSYRPGRYAAQVGCPLLVVVSGEDRSTVPEDGVRAAEAAPQGDLVRIPGGHYAPFLEGHEQVVAAELAFLDRTLGGSRPARI